MKFTATVVYETATTIVIEADSLEAAQAQYDRILHLNLSEFHAMGAIGHGFEVYAIEQGRNGLESLEDVKLMEDAR